MPRALDRQQITADYDPTRSGTEFHFGYMLKDTLEIVADALAQFTDNMAELVIDQLGEILGIDLSGIKPLLAELSLDFSSAEAFLVSLFNAAMALPSILIEIITGIIGSDWGINLGALLGNPDLTLPPGLFDPIQQVVNFIQSILHPTGSVFTEWSLLGGGAPGGLTMPFGLPTVLPVVTAVVSALQNFADNLQKFLFADFTADGFNLATAVSSFIQRILHPTGSVFTEWSLLGGASPGLTLPFPLPTVLPLVEAVVSALQRFTDNLQAFLFADFTAGGFDLGQAVQSFITNILGPQGLLADLVDGILPDSQAPQIVQGIIDTIFQTFMQSSSVGHVLDDLITALQNIPFLNVLGIGGPANIGDALQSTWDQLISGFVGSFGTSTGLADLFNISFDVSSSASLGRLGWDILGIRNNKPLDSGLLATSGANFGLSRVAMQSSAPTIAVTQAVSAIGFMRMEQSNNKAVVSWLGSGVTNITACFVNIWKMDPNVGSMELVHRSPNIAGNLSATMAWVVYQMPTPLLTQAAETFGIEITVQGAGTHSVVGTTTWIPLHPNAFPRSYAATRNSGTAEPPLGMIIPAASISYATAIPWIEWGVTVGASTVPHSDQTVMFSTVGSLSLPVPTWANFVDAIAIGGGGGGGGGAFLVTGEGGRAGLWSTTTWERGTHFTGPTSVDVITPPGGAGGTGGVLVPDNATAGGGASVSIPGYTVTASGGAKGRAASLGGHNDTGLSPGNQTYDEVVYNGGGTQGASGGAGAAPGGGGGGGNGAHGPGGAGGRGGVWLVFRQN